MTYFSPSESNSVADHGYNQQLAPHYLIRREADTGLVNNVVTSLNLLLLQTGQA